MKIPGALPGIALALLLHAAAHGQAVDQQNLATVSSPDKQIRMIVYERRLNSGERQLNYRVEYQHKLVVFDSRLDFQAEGVPLLVAEGRPARATTHGNQRLLEVKLAGTDRHRAPATLQLRADNGGVAFRLHAPALRVTRDVAEFAMPVGARIAAGGGADKDAGQPVELAGWRGPAAQPLALTLLGAISVKLEQTPMAHFTADYAPATYQPDTIASTISGDGAVPTQARPWRRILVAGSARPRTSRENNDEDDPRIPPPLCPAAVLRSRAAAGGRISMVDDDRRRRLSRNERLCACLPVDTAKLPAGARHRHRPA